MVFHVMVELLVRDGRWMLVQLDVYASHSSGPGFPERLMKKYGDGWFNVVQEAEDWIFSKYVSNISRIIDYVWGDINRTRDMLRERGLDLQMAQYSSEERRDIMNAEIFPVALIEGKAWRLRVGKVSILGPLLYSPRIYIMYDVNDSLLIYENKIKIIINMIDEVEVPSNLTVGEEDLPEIIANTLGTQNYTLIRGPGRILAYNPRSGEATPYYWLMIAEGRVEDPWNTTILCGNESVYELYINAVTGDAYKFGVYAPWKNLVPVISIIVIGGIGLAIVLGIAWRLAGRG